MGKYEDVDFYQTDLLLTGEEKEIRHLCDLEAISTLEGTAGMHTLVIGQEITGISAFK